MNIYSPGARIAGRYEVASRPLMGGMGEVYLCLDLETIQPYALNAAPMNQRFHLPSNSRNRFCARGIHSLCEGSLRATSRYFIHVAASAC